MPRPILVVRFGSLGDVILTSAAVLNLKISFREHPVVFLTKRRFGDLVAAFDGVDKVVTVDDDISAPALFRFLLNLDRRDFEMIVDLHGNLRSRMVRSLLTANRKVQYPKRRRERERLVRRQDIPESWPHTIDQYNEAVRQVGGHVYARRPVIRPMGGKARQSGGDADRPRIAFAPGAAHPNKQWGLDRFAETARILHAESGAVVYWLVTGADAGRSALDKVLPAGDFHELVDRPIPELIGVLRGMDLTIANDSGVAHLSSAVGTPVRAVFGPTHPALGFAPRGLLDQVVDVDEFCRPCSLHGDRPCWRERRFCFDRIEPRHVAAAASQLFERRHRASKALFLDRDGTIIKNKHFARDPDSIEFEPGSIEALHIARKHDYKLVIVSNQSGVARGYFTTDDVERFNGRLLELLGRENIQIHGVFYCPHFPQGAEPLYSRDCNCRKPAAGMVEAAADQLDIDIRTSVIIGDRLDDIELGRVTGARGILVRTGHGRRDEQLAVASYGLEQIEVADNLNAAVELLTRG